MDKVSHKKRSKNKLQIHYGLCEKCPKVMTHFNDYVSFF